MLLSSRPPPSRHRIMELRKQSDECMNENRSESCMLEKNGSLIELQNMNDQP